MQYALGVTDEPGDDGHAEAGASTVCFCGEVGAGGARLKDLVQHIRGDSVAGVTHFDHCKRAGLFESFPVDDPL